MLPTIEQLIAFDTAVPRYTSYPTAPEWVVQDASCYQEHLQKLSFCNKPISLYFHIPFCKTMCLYCACSVVLNRNPQIEDEYVRQLIKELRLVASVIGRKKVVQIHFGGGTPTKLSERHFQNIMDEIHAAFDIEAQAEIAIEIDPRTVVEDEARKLTFLKDIGFNRVSFGVQDLDQKVQEAVRRRQSYEVTKSTFEKAQALGFESINIDLIYGLPFQTEDSFEKTVQGIISMKPDRIALFSYAKVPWLKPHQKAIREQTLPSTEEKFRIYLKARKKFTSSGYQAIGMDHFALSNDELAASYHKKTLHRNFQGYTVLGVDDMIGFGMTAIGYVQGAFFQNNKELTSYYRAIDERAFPVARGKVLSQDDTIRRYIIQRLMCDFTVEKKDVETRFEIVFDHYFQKDIERLRALEAQGLVTCRSDRIDVTELGEFFVRLVASSFDLYYHNRPQQRCFSKAV